MSSTPALSGQSEDPDNSQKIQKLFLEIKALSEAKYFIRAEKLRDTLMGVAPMALQEIIDSAEVMENGSRSVDAAP